MYKYLARLKEVRPMLNPGYVDWLVTQTAISTGVDEEETKAALLGYSHSHLHADGDTVSVSVEGCAVHASLPTERDESFSENHGLEDHNVEEEAHAGFSVVDESTDDHIAFKIIRKGAVFTDYEVSHEKEMHLIIVRDDLRHFFHVHPERDAEGTWHLDFSPDAGGTYWMFADFVETGTLHHTLRIDRTYPEDRGNTGVIKDERTAKAIGDYIVTFAVNPYSHGTLFSYSVRDQNGRSPFFEEFMGTTGHTILVSPNGDFMHTHPSPAGDALTFKIDHPPLTFEMHHLG